MNKVLHLLLVLTASGPCSQAIDYYWRPYNGLIPEDALPAGRDSNGNHVFIGQGYENKLGVFVGTLIRGRSEMEYSAYGVKKTSKYIRILCAEHFENFVWLTTSSDTFKNDTSGEHLVPGGHNYEKQKNYSIGRLMYDGSAQVGEVTSYLADSKEAELYCAYKDKHFRKIRQYQVLTYKVGH